ncbi:Casparian strip membrane protein domain [Dillenia turbinata]|uniref:CASP-like protein n=1 Tax=Dillenia turbinata TaxID=194707 RepID=A0AAN8WE39_9MAGN
MGSGLLKIEALLRAFALGILLLGAILVALDSETEAIIYTIKKTATFKDMDALIALVCVDAAAAAYNLLQLSRYIVHTQIKIKSIESYLKLAWTNFLLDQVITYVQFATNSAALEASTLAITGARSLQWMKVCNRFTRFCVQIGSALLCGYVASLLMILLSLISAFNLFRFYCPKQFFLLKGR